jgi:hypothetical protein
LDAPNVETRDTWCHHLQRVIASAANPNESLGRDGWGAPPDSGTSVPAAGTGGDAGESAADGAAGESVALGSALLVDLAVPPGCSPGGCELRVKLRDGRTVTVAVPPHCPPGTLLRAALPPLAAGASPPPRQLAEEGGGVAAADAGLAADACTPRAVPVLVPCSRRMAAGWSEGVAAGDQQRPTSPPHGLRGDSRSGDSRFTRGESALSTASEGATPPPPPPPVVKGTKFSDLPANLSVRKTS